MDNTNIGYKNLKISPLTKKRLDILKGKLTYDKYFDLVFGYFEMTGVDPKYNQLPPQVSITKAIKEECNVLYKRIEDNIKITRAIEDQKIIPILKGVETLLNGKNNLSENSNIGPKEEEVYQLIQYNQELESKVISLNNTIQSLKNKLNDIDKSFVVQDIIEDLKELLSDKMLTKDKDGNLLLSLDFRDNIIKKMETYLHV